MGDSNQDISVNRLRMPFVAEESELSKEQQKIIREETLNYARGIYIEGCLKNGEEDEDIEQATKEGLDWYDYIYKNEKCPR